MNSSEEGKISKVQPNRCVPCLHSLLAIIWVAWYEFLDFAANFLIVFCLYYIAIEGYVWKLQAMKKG